MGSARPEQPGDVLCVCGDHHPAGRKLLQKQRAEGAEGSIIVLRATTDPSSDLAWTVALELRLPTDLFPQPDILSITLTTVRTQRFLLLALARGVICSVPLPEL